MAQDHGSRVAIAPLPAVRAGHRASRCEILANRSIATCVMGISADVLTRRMRSTCQFNPFALASNAGGRSTRVRLPARSGYVTFTSGGVADLRAYALPTITGNAGQDTACGSATDQPSRERTI